jgi:hypothetical protein
MSAIVGIAPAFAHRRIKKVFKQIVWVKGHRVLRFQRTRTLEIGEAFQLITG